MEPAASLVFWELRVIMWQRQLSEQQWEENSRQHDWTWTRAHVESSSVVMKKTPHFSSTESHLAELRILKSLLHQELRERM